MNNFNDELKARQQHVNAVIKDYLPEEKGFQKTLLSAMNYSMEAGGKRLRPIMLECTYQMFGGSDSMAAPFMAAIEMIHTSSLVHDDLPALDNDSLRRGMKTTHKAYGEPMAILAGDALLNYAYETALKAFTLAEKEPDTAVRGGRIARALSVLAGKSGIHGMLGGQSCDVEHDGRPLTESQVEYIDDNKTAALIEASLMTGAILAGASEDDVRLLEQTGRDVGLAFQIRDDILDVTGSEQELGKPVGSDVRNRKTTYVSLFGVKAAALRIEELSRSAIEKFDSLDAKHDFLRELLIQLSVRRS